MEQYDGFREKVLKLHENRNHKIKNSYGVRDAFLYYRKIKPKDSKYVLKDVEYFAIIRHINNALQEELSLGNDIVFPERMGRLEIRKYSNSIKFENGKLKTKLAIDWDRTLNLWKEDEDCFKNKVLVKHNPKESFKILYNKNKACYNNKTLFSFKPNRNLKIKLINNIREGIIDTFNVY